MHAATFGGDESTLGLVTTEDIIRIKSDFAIRIVGGINADLVILAKGSDNSFADIALANGAIMIDRAHRMAVAPEQLTIAV